MNKSELISAVAARAGMSKKATDLFLDAFTDSITVALAKDDKVQIVGFGTFEVRKRSARDGINPLTKAKIKIAASKAPAFKAGKALKDAVN